MWKTNFTRLKGTFPPASLDKVARNSFILLAGESVTQDLFFSSLKSKQPITTDQITDGLHLGDDELIMEESDSYAEQEEQED
jgi:hypothetical protein